MPVRSLYRRLDLFNYKRIKDESELEPSRWGVAVSCIAAIVMALLFFAEFTAFLNKDVHSEIVLDSSLDQHLRVHFNLSVPKYDGDTTSDDHSTNSLYLVYVLTWTD